MHKAFINPHKCLRCTKCYAATLCPIKAIFRIDAAEPAVVEPDTCHGCGDCVGKCPVQAIIIK